MGLYKYISFSNLKYLLDGTVRFTQPKAFNDPFELLPEIWLTDTNNQLELSFDITAHHREGLPARLADDFESEYCSDVLARDILNSINESIGILCLSKNPDSLLMWSHYADEYKGAVVEFDETHEFFTGLFPVSYETNRPKIDFTLLKDNSGNIRLSELCYKSQEWRYENEFRIARGLKNCKKTGESNGFDVRVMEIPLECIKGITMGERMPTKDQQYILSKIAETNIKLGLAAISNWGYNFRAEPIKYDCPLSEMTPTMSPRTAHLFKDLKGDLGDIARSMIADHPMAGIANKTL